MKTIFTLSILFSTAIVAYGQWNTSGSNIYNTNSGNVGIGTQNPVSKLNVVDGDIRISATTSSRRLILDAVSSVNLSSMITIRRDNITRWSFGATGFSGVDDFEFFRYSNAGSFLGSALKIQRATGNVGIGTVLSTNPNNYKLAVNGKIGAKEVQVENTSSTWADHVFKPDYELLSLEEVESFVRTNGHLPEIPSKKDIEKYGHKLGEMDVRLLTKIEEITLYLLELKKQVKKLEEDNLRLKKLVEQGD